MLPPEEVPQGLSHPEYMKLQLRYNAIGWLRQGMSAAHLAVKSQPQSEHMSDEAKARAGAMFSAMEKVLILGEVTEDIEKSIKGFTDHTLNEADKMLDNIEHLKQTKDGLKAVFSLVSQTVQDTIDGSLQNHVLPALGMPLDRIPQGKTTEEYFRLAVRYEQIGACEPARECLQFVLDRELKQDTQLANQAQRFLKCKLPARRINHDAMIKYMSALRYSVTGKHDRAKDILVELEVKHPNFEWPLIPLAALELKEGNINRCKHLLTTAQKINPNFVKMWCAKGRLALAEWYLLDLDYCVERVSSLDSFDFGAKALVSMQQFINQNGLR